MAKVFQGAGGLQNLSVRDATRADLPRITAIYNHAIEQTVATFDLTPLDEPQRERWFAQFDAHHPLLVAESESHVLGFAYFLPYRARSGYARTKEMTVYVDFDARRQGIARALYAALIDRARSNDVHVLMAVLGGENAASVALHRSLGFVEVGHYREVGYKFGEWVDTHTFQLIL